jgi:hypothetical protein
MSSEEIIKEKQLLKEELEKPKNELMETTDKLKNYITTLKEAKIL